jgi:hypothetical protein
MYEITEGSKYQATRDLDIAEIAKLVRKDIKAAQALGLLPAEATFAVRIDRFSGGQSLDVTLTGMPDTWTYVSPGLEPDYANYVPAHGGYTDEAEAAIKTLRSIVFTYNYDGSDIQSDYFNVRFYGHVKIQDEREQAFWVKERERQAARRWNRQQARAAR